MDQALLTINGWIMADSQVAMAGAFLWGVVSVALSPCHLASIPLMVGYVAGQHAMPRPGQAALYSLVFTLGLFITIALVGLVCAVLGRMLGDIGSWWTIPMGLLLLWVALDMLGYRVGGLPGGGAWSRLRPRGLSGALTLGLSYGLLSGTCTFGFLAPVLAVVAAQRQVASGAVLIGLFGLGHALPVAIAGFSMALVGGLLENRSFLAASQYMRKVAGVGVGCLGFYFLALPFVET